MINYLGAVSIANGLRDKWLENESEFQRFVDKRKICDEKRAGAVQTLYVKNIFQFYFQ